VDAFISHSSEDREIAGELERGLEAGGLSVWFDDSDIRIGVLLGKELRGSIRECRVLVLVWSAAAAESR
jgi:TIR domain